jgi:hypothetical protein
MSKKLVFLIVVLSLQVLCKSDDDFVKTSEGFENSIEPLQTVTTSNGPPYFLLQIVHGSSSAIFATCSAIAINSTDAISYGNCFQDRDVCIRYTNIISDTFRNSSTTCYFSSILHPKYTNPGPESTNFGIAKVKKLI